MSELRGGVASVPLFKVKILDVDFGGIRQVILNVEDATERVIKAGERVRLSKGDRVCTASVALSSTIVSPGEILLPKSLAEELKVLEGDLIGVRVAETPQSALFIKKKLLGSKLSPEEIRAIIRDIVDGSLGDGEIAAFLSAQEIHGLTIDELESLTRAMVDTGARIEFDESAYDEHSIGGVPGNSKVALIAVPIVASAGLLIPKTSSRAITSPAGTADTMEVLANVEFTPEELKEIALKTKGVIAWGGSLNIAPADDIFIRVENKLMLDPPTQMVASILAKKLAIGINVAIIDIPVGKGAKVEDMKRAEELSRIFIEQSGRLGIRLKCAISYGGQPIGYTIGPALEAKEALQTLVDGKGAGSLVEKAIGIAGILFEEAGLTARGGGISLARKLLEGGVAYEKFKEIIEAQGGDPKVKPEDLPIGDKHVTIEAPTDGYVTHVDNTALTLIARAAGAPIDKGAGIKLYVKAGSKVKSGEKLFTIYSESSVKLAYAHSLAQRLHPITLEGMILRTIPE